MTNKDLEKYEKVNECESLEQLANAILSFANSMGELEGRTNIFNAKEMAKRCLVFSLDNPNLLTRMWGIRQQAMYIVHYPKGSLLN